MNKKPETGKYFPVRVIGDFDKQVAQIADRYAMSKAGAVRYCVKRVFEQEFPQAPASKK